MLSYEGAAAAKEGNFRNQDTGGRRSIHRRGLASLRMAMQNPSQRLSVSEDGSASCVDGVQFRRVGIVQIYNRKESKKFRVYIQHTTFLIGKEIRQSLWGGCQSIEKGRAGSLMRGNRLLKNSIEHITEETFSPARQESWDPAVIPWIQGNRWTARHRKSLEWEQPHPVSIHYITAQH